MAEDSTPIDMIINRRAVQVAPDFIKGKIACDLVGGSSSLVRVRVEQYRAPGRYTASSSPASVKRVNVFCVLGQDT